MKVRLTTMFTVICVVFLTACTAEVEVKSEPASARTEKICLDGVLYHRING